MDFECKNYIRFEKLRNVILILLYFSLSKDRLPRNLLFSWMHTSRSVGRKWSYGKTTITTLIKENLKLNHDKNFEYE